MMGSGAAVVVDEWRVERVMTIFENLPLINALY